MRDTTQVRAMDDYFHSLLLDDALLLDSSDEPDSAPVIQLQRQPQPVVDKVAQPYLEADQRLEQLSELLAQVGQVQFEIDALSHEEVVSEPLQIEAEDALLPVEPVWPEVMPEPAAADPATLVVTETDVALAPQEEVSSTWENIDTGKEFQALFFEVAGVTFAVPLTELGGIHQLGEVNTLFGQPGWYKGIMTSREQKMNVVDTAQWVMPGQHLEVPDYKYLIMLGESPGDLPAII